MTIHRSQSQDNLLHPLVQAGYNVPWLDNDDLYRDLTPTQQKVCATCKKVLIFGTQAKGYCSVKCRQMGK